MDDIEQKIKNYILREFLPDELLLDSDLPLIQQGIVDSLGILQLVSFIEEEFNIKIAPEDVVLKNFAMVNEIKKLVMAKLPSAQGG